ncbi:MAG: membrane protein insertase YidC [Alistipes sp.]|jgi:YidC/Oxa1 family membrane protein insertase|nr:membrane protein insertase YidC [Alistipes sp.]
MNKQTVLGFILIGAILFGFTWYQGRQQQKFQEATAVADSIARANAPEPVAPVLDSAAVASGLGVEGPATPDPLGDVMAAARISQPSTFIVENDVASYEFSTLGGAISDVVLKDYKKYGGEPLHMWKPGSGAFDVEFFVRRGGRDAQVNTREFNFTAADVVETPDGGKQVVMRLAVDSLAGVEFVYTIPKADYMIGYEVCFTGMEGQMSNQSSFDVDWRSTSLQNEKGFDNENNYTTVAYRYPEVASVEQLGVVRAGGTKSESEPARVQWVAFKQQYFSSILVADDAFAGADMEMATHRPGDGTVKEFHTRVSVPMEPERDAYGFRMYFGPNQFSTLKSYDMSMERIISMGFMSFGWVTRILVVPVFDWLGGRIASFGLIIFILAFLIKLVIFPLTFTSYRSSAKMRLIKPEVDEINAKYPDQADAMKKQQATMELYRRAGINPLAGCIPMLIQFPIIIAMFRFFPVAIELRGQRLWWAEDLSSYDSVLDLGFTIPFYGDHVSGLALLMAVSMYFYSLLNFKQQPAQAGMPGMKFMMLYMMPIMMLLWFNNYSAGLCYYYLLGNLFTIVQMYGVRLFIDEDKLRRKMLETPRKEKKKSGFMQRLEEAQKAQAAAARAQQSQASARDRRDAPPVIRGPRTQPGKKR